MMNLRTDEGLKEKRKKLKVHASEEETRNSMKRKACRNSISLDDLSARIRRLERFAEERSPPNGSRALNNRGKERKESSGEKKRKRSENRVAV